MSKIEEIEAYVLEVYIKEIIKFNGDGTRYVLEEDVEKCKLPDAFYEIFVKVLEKNRIELKKSVIGQTTKSPFVTGSDFLSVRDNSLGNLTQVGYSKLENFIDNEFLPAYCELKSIENKETKEIEIFPIIQLSKIMELKLSEKEFEYVIKYLKEKGIRVIDVGSILDGEVGSYDYYGTFKDSLLPKRLTPKENEEKFLLFEITKDPVLREQLILGNMRLVSYLAWNFSRIYDVDIHELEQAGYESLINAVDTYSLKLGSFVRYVSKLVIPNFMDCLTVMLSEKPRKLNRQIQLSIREVEEETGEKLSENPKLIDNVIALLLLKGYITRTGVQFIKQAINLLQSLSLDEVEEYAEINIDSVSSLAMSSIRSDDIKKVLATLLPIEEFIIRHRFGIDVEQLTQGAIAKKIGVSTSYVQQIEHRALRKLRHPDRTKYLRDYYNLDDEMENTTNFKLK